MCVHIIIFLFDFGFDYFGLETSMSWIVIQIDIFLLFFSVLRSVFGLTINKNFAVDFGLWPSCARHQFEPGTFQKVENIL